jgi:hypothetical protein
MEAIVVMKNDLSDHGIILGRNLCACGNPIVDAKLLRTRRKINLRE